MVEKQNRTLAVQRAEKYAPPPADNAPMSGIVGASVIGVVLVVVASFYVIDIPTYWILFSALLILGFVIPFLHSSYRRGRHVRATSAELKTIEKEAAHPNRASE